MPELDDPVLTPGQDLDLSVAPTRDPALGPERSPFQDLIASGFDAAYERPGQTTMGETVQGLVSEEARLFGASYAIQGVAAEAFGPPADPVANARLTEALATPMGREVLLPTGLTGQTPQEVAQGQAVGDDVVVLLDREAAMGFGHTAVLVGNDVEGWDLFSKDGTRWVGGIVGPSSWTNDAGRGQEDRPMSRSYDTLDDFFEDRDMSRFYEAAVRVEFEGGADRGDAVRAAATGILNEPYDLLQSSCAHTVQAALEALQKNPEYGVEGFDIRETVALRGIIRPEVQFGAVGQQEAADDVRSRAQIDWELRSAHDGF